MSSCVARASAVLIAPQSPDGLGEIATQLTGLPPNHSSLEPYFDLAEEHDLPVLVHTAVSVSG
jgi:hypothetical protein